MEEEYGLEEIKKDFHPQVASEVLQDRIRELVMCYAPSEWSLDNAGAVTVKIYNIFKSNNVAELNREIGA